MAIDLRKNIAEEVRRSCRLLTPLHVTNSLSLAMWEQYSQMQFDKQVMRDAALLRSQGVLYATENTELLLLRGYNLGMLRENQLPNDFVATVKPFAHAELGVLEVPTFCNVDTDFLMFGIRHGDFTAYEVDIAYDLGKARRNRLSKQNEAVVKRRPATDQEILADVLATCSTPLEAQLAILEYAAGYASGLDHLKK